MGEETRMNLDTSYYNGEKTEYTCVAPGTHVSNTHIGTAAEGTHVKHEQYLTVPDGTHFENTVIAEKDISCRNQINQGQ